jgi:hypothetical protein
MFCAVDRWWKTLSAPIILLTGEHWTVLLKFFSITVLWAGLTGCRFMSVIKTASHSITWSRYGLASVICLLLCSPRTSNLHTKKETTVVHSFGHLSTKKREISCAFDPRKREHSNWSSFGRFSQKHVFFSIKKARVSLAFRVLPRAFQKLALFKPRFSNRPKLRTLPEFPHKNYYNFFPKNSEIITWWKRV